jgi:hypothetical protein
MGYSGNLVRLSQKPDQPRLTSYDPEHSNPAGPDTIDPRLAEQSQVPAGYGQEYAGTDLDRQVEATGGELTWNVPSAASVPIGSGQVVPGQVPGWTHGDPHTPASAGDGWSATSVNQPDARTALHDGHDAAQFGRGTVPLGADRQPYSDHRIGYPQASMAEPTGDAAQKLIGGLNSYAANNPEGVDPYNDRQGAKAPITAENPLFAQHSVHLDHGAQTYERRTAPLTSTEPLVGGQTYTNTTDMGQLAANPFTYALATPAPAADNYGPSVGGEVY